MIKFLLWLLLVVGSGHSCFLNSSHTMNDSNNLTCTLSHPSFGTNSTCDRIRPNVFKVMGDYEVFHINCTAPFPLELDYDGFRPTEAVRLSYWNEVETEFKKNGTEFESRTTSYGLTITISSIQRLYEHFRDTMDDIRPRIPNVRSQNFYLHENEDPPIVYPRTAKFTLTSRHKNTNTRAAQSFYIFFEEPLLTEVSFVHNEHTSHFYFEEKNKTKIIIPCRPSHLTWKVKLWMTSRSNEVKDVTSNGLYDPVVGFKLVVQDIKDEGKLQEIKFQCSTQSHSSSRSGSEVRSLVYRLWEGTGLPIDPAFGQSLLLMKKNVNNLIINRGSSVASSNRTVPILRCGLGLPPSNFGMFYYGLRSRTVTELRFSREFALPMFANLSYGTQQGYWDAQTFGIIKDPANDGALFCTNRGEFNFIEFTTGINGLEAVVHAGNNWFGRQWKSIEDSQIKIRLESPLGSKIFYSHVTLVFTCQVAGFSLIKPILWFIKEKQRKIQLVPHSQEFEGEVSTLKIKLGANTTQIFCLAPRWLSNEWRRDSLDLNIIDKTPLKITTNIRSYNFSQNSNDHEIICKMEGSPLPLVWWEREGVPILGSRNIGIGRYELPNLRNESLGTYICKGRNDLNEIEAEFQIFLVESQDSLDIITIIVPSFLVVFIIFVILVYLYYKRRTRRNLNILTAAELAEFRKGVPNKLNDYSMQQPYNSAYEISLDRFIVHQDKVLGSGAFGRVLAGMVDNKPVAVKTLAKGADKIFLKSLLSELKLFIYLGDHPNIVGLVGASTVKLNMGIVHVFVEMCDLGSLLGHVRKHRLNFMLQSTIEFGLRVLHQWAFEIAQGMAYLSLKRVIHGDLAARNVLLSSDRTAKITDFGLSRQLYESSMYMKQNQEPLPWRSMALESLIDLTFTCESDVWGYGVTLWEVYSLGQVPFPGVHWDIDFVEGLKSGQRLNCPSMISQNLYSRLLAPCWEKEAEDRPTFNTLSEILQEILERDYANQSPSRRVPMEMEAI